VAPDSRDPYAGPTDAERRARGRRILSVSSAIVIGLLVALVLLAIVGVVLR
jgi:hypothetical protein